MANELTLPERAAVALGAAEHEKQLMLLASEAKTITEIKNKDGREQCHSMMMTLKNTRVAIEKTSKTAREDATAFSKAVIAEERRLIAITEAEETRLQGLRDAWDTAIEAERQAKINAERERVERIAEAIAALREGETDAIHICKTADDVRKEIEYCEAKAITQEIFQERYEEAVAVQAQVLASMRATLVDRIESEAEAARIAAEREELARLRAEVETRRAEDERKAAAERAAVARQQAVLEAAQAQREAKKAPVETKEVVDSLGTYFDHTSIKENGDPVLRNKDGSRSIFCDIDDDGNTPVTPPTLKLGEINARIAPLSISADGLRQLGFEPAGRERAAVLYHESNWPEMRAAMIDHLRTEEQQQQAA